MLGDEHTQGLTHNILFSVRSKSSSNIAGYFRRDHQALHEHDAQAYSTLAEASNGSVVRFSLPRNSRRMKLTIHHRLSLTLPVPSAILRRSAMPQVAHDANVARNCQPVRRSSLTTPASQLSPRPAVCTHGGMSATGPV